MDHPLITRARAQAIEAARDLATEHNDAPSCLEKLESRDHHARVITGTGNAGERRELEALCRGLQGAC